MTPNQQNHLAATLAEYERTPWRADLAENLDRACMVLCDRQGDPDTQAFLAVLARALDEDGYRWIPAARCALVAVQTYEED